ncbi:MAG TPA: biotin--[acetyl-CoA-carboxylase] ligase [Actinomycetota bacterium]|nr:biotin--[acetyl-CoA-carboxylase] ligase [Actinomycetota bacterium]
MEEQEAAFRVALRGQLGLPLEFHGTLDSTNRRAAEWASNGAPHGALVVADHQTAGRGRHGRTWLSHPGAGLLFSLILRGHDYLDSPGVLTTALGVAVAQGITDAAEIATSVKWPNDVYSGGRKLAGILVETTTGTADAAVIAGIGVNVSLPPSKLPRGIAERATSIVEQRRRVTEGPPPGRAELLAHTLLRFEQLWAEVATNGPGELMTTATSLSEVLGRHVLITLPGGTSVEGEATGLTHEGALVVDSPDGRMELMSGEVELLRSS